MQPPYIRSLLAIFRTMTTASEHASLDALVADLDDPAARAMWAGLRARDNAMDGTVDAAKAAMDTHDTELYEAVYRAIRAHLLTDPYGCAELYKRFYRYQLARTVDMASRLVNYEAFGSSLMADAAKLG